MIDEYQAAVYERLHAQIMTRLELRELLARDDADEIFDLITIAAGYPEQWPDAYRLFLAWSEWAN